MGTALLASGALLLAAEPAAWLFHSWTDPATRSLGWVVFAGALATFWWSASSALVSGGAVPRLPLILLMGTAALRAIGQVLDIDTISALALGVDVYALAKVLQLDHRARAISPLFLAALFLTSLPIERLMQRTIGQMLQEVSADGACLILSAVFPNVTCAGTRITVAGAQVMVDLPCAGIGGLTLLASAMALAATLARPGLSRALTAGLVSLPCALIGNALRVALLSAGAALDLPLLAEPWHSLIGLVTLAIMALPPLAILTGGTTPQTTRATTARRPVPLAIALPFAALAALIIVLPSAPLDRATARTVTLPLHLDGNALQPQALSSQESTYFATYGGGAAKGIYGPLGLLVTDTASPLRHLHDPQDCLRGLGMAVNFIGTALGPHPASLYDVTDATGARWHAAVTFVASDGTSVPTVSAAIWHWFTHPGTTWRGIQRLTPADLPPATRSSLDAAIFAALDISPSQNPEP